MERCGDNGRCGDVAPKLLPDEEDMKIVKKAVAAEEEEMDAAEVEMRATDFIVAYKRLPEKEIDFILAQVRIPYRRSADNIITEEEHEQAQESFFRFQEQVRREYEATGVFRVDDAYVAGRVEKEAIIHEAWSTMFDDSDLSDSDFGYQCDFDDLEEMDGEVINPCSATDKN